MMRRKLELIAGAGLILAWVMSLTYAIAAEEVATPASKIEGAGNAWKTPLDSMKIEIAPPGIDKDSIPGQGKHLGWSIGQHKGWAKAEAASQRIATEMAKAGVSEKDVKAAVADFRQTMQKWISERPKFDINATGENGIAGFRQAVKKWLDDRPELAETIKELNIDVDVSQ